MESIFYTDVHYILSSLAIFILFPTQLLGTPEDSDLGFLRSENARKYVKQLPRVSKQSFPEKFPELSPIAIDLAEKMLVFDPSKRITGMPLNIPYIDA